MLKVCLTDGTRMRGAERTVEWSDLDTQGSLWVLHIPRLLDLKQICWEGNVGTQQLYRCLTFEIWNPCFDLKPQRADRTEAATLQRGLEQKVGLFRNASCGELGKTKMCRERTDAQLLRIVPPCPVKPTLFTGQGLDLHRGTQQTAAE